MMFAQPPPITALPAGYQRVKRLVLTETRTLTLLNLFSLALAVPFFALMIVWTGAVRSLRGPVGGDVAGLPDLILWLAVLLVLPLHEWIHGLAIRWARHTPRYGMKSVSLGPVKIPVVLFATADDAYFRRDQFVVVALAPVVVITPAGMLLLAVLPDALAIYLSVAVIINGAGAIGDLWMTAVALRYPPDALIQDEADAISVFVHAGETTTTNETTRDHLAGREHADM